MLLFEMRECIRYKIGGATTAIGDILCLQTAYFKAERNSVLHSGIYTKEMSSMFFAFIISTVYIIYQAFYGHLYWMHYIIAVVAFIILFPIIRIFIFKKNILTVVFDRQKDLITISKNSIIRNKNQPHNSLREITIVHDMIEPQNQDGIEFVKKISLAHGAPMPDLGATQHFYNVYLSFPNENIMIFTSPISTESEQLVKTIKDFYFNHSTRDLCQKEQI
jgi:hypothetical protein